MSHFGSTPLLERRFPDGSSLWIALAVVLALTACPGRQALAQGLSFQNVVIDTDSPTNPHTQTLGDISGDVAAAASP